jgi:hypothetical protein
MDKRQFGIVEKPMEGQVCPEHKRPGANLIHWHQGGISHLESCLAQQALDPETQLLGS